MYLQAVNLSSSILWGSFNGEEEKMKFMKYQVAAICFVLIMALGFLYVYLYLDINIKIKGNVLIIQQGFSLSLREFTDALICRLWARSFTCLEYFVLFCFGKPLLQAWLLPDLTTTPNNCVRENFL